MAKTTLPVIEVSEYEAVASMTVEDFLDTTVAARDFLPRARNSVLVQREVDRLRGMHDLVQRDFAGAKRTNARGPLAHYVRTAWLPESNGQPSPGILPPFSICYTDYLEIEDGYASLPSKKAFISNGESRGESFLYLLEGDDLSEMEKNALLAKRIATTIRHGIHSVDILKKYFADEQGRGVSVNPNLVAMTDITDPFVGTTESVFDRLGLELELRNRQVSGDRKIMTGIQAKAMVGAMVFGTGVVGYGSKPYPTTNVDFDLLEEAAVKWLGKVFDRFPRAIWRAQDRILRSTSVGLAFGALGRPYYDGSMAKLRSASEQVLKDSQIDWKLGPHWAGIAGKVNPVTQAFSVGGTKEYVHATYAALQNQQSPGYYTIRHLPMPAPAP